MMWGHPVACVIHSTKLDVHPNAKINININIYIIRVDFISSGSNVFLDDSR